MPRRLRYVPENGTLVEVTCRIIHGRMLLKPNRPLNEMIAGTLARGKRRYGVRICAVAVLSNHAHLLLEVDDACQLSRFMCFVKSKIAREVSRRRHWREKIWGRRFTAIVVSSEPAAQAARLRYVLSQGVKEHLVARCSQWPGVHAAEALVTGRTLVGYWFNRTAEYRARKQGKDFGADTFAELEPLTFDQLPCWRHLDRGCHRARVKEMVESIEADAATDRRRRGIAPLGIKAIQRQNAKRRPRRAKRLGRSIAPAFHAASKKVRRTLMEGYRWFEATYRDAADRMREGDRQAPFPEGSFPPALPFVGLSVSPAS